MSDNITYLSEIVLSLQELNGMGSLKEINQLIEKRDLLPAIHTNPNWKKNVSATIQRHCSDTKSFSGGEDLFYPVYGLGEGYWGLRDISQWTDTDNPIIIRQICRIKKLNIDITEKEMLIKARIGQGIFRDLLIEKYGSCIITGIDDTRLLVASHIKPWRSSDNHERLSPENGLLLSPLYDKLFDIGLISFDKSMKIIFSNKLSANNIARLRIDNDKTYIDNPSNELLHNMEYHRDVIFK